MPVANKKPDTKKEQKPAKMVSFVATLMWAKLIKPNDEGKFTVDLTQISERAANALLEAGYNIKTSEKKEDYGFFTTVYSRRPITSVVYEDDEPIDPATIGNGSKARVYVTPYEWTYKNKSGVSMNISKIVVSHHEVYIPGGDTSEAADLDDEY